MTHKEIFDYWIKRLNLSDWKIDVIDPCSPNDFVSDWNNEGECYYNEYLKTATIRILGEDYCNDKCVEYNFELTLLHELLHIKFALLDDSDNKLQNRLVHILVEELARSLYYARLDGGK